jgi:hypothetical protein
VSADSSKELFEVLFFHPISILCPSQYALAKAGQKVQYTYAVLPSFLVPRSRITLPNLIEACQAQASQPELAIKQIALLLPAKSPKTYRRLKKQLDGIIPGLLIEINQETIRLGGSSQVPACRQPRSFIEQLQDCARVYADQQRKVPGQRILAEDEVYPHLFARCQAWKKTKQECPVPSPRGP